MGQKELKEWRICTEDVPETIMAETADEAWQIAIQEVGAYPMYEEDEEDA